MRQNSRTRAGMIAVATAVLLGAGQALAGAPAACRGSGGQGAVGHGAPALANAAVGRGAPALANAAVGRGAPALANAAVGRGAPALANAAVGGYPTQFRGHSYVRTFPSHGRYSKGGYSGGNFVYSSRGINSGNISYRSCTNVPLYGWTTLSCGGGIYPWYYYPYYCADSGYWDWPLYEVERRVGSPSQVVVVVVQPKVDEALESLEAGRFAAARLMYLARAEERRQAEEDGTETGVDRTALRLAALAAAGERRYPEADRLFAEAYAQEPSLAARPMDGATLVGGAPAMRKIVNGAVAYAYKVGTPDAWKMVAWLMQAEGRNDRARAMMDRAEQIADKSDATTTGLGASQDEQFAVVER